MEQETDIDRAGRNRLCNGLRNAVFNWHDSGLYIDAPFSGPVPTRNYPGRTKAHTDLLFHAYLVCGI